MGTAWTWGTVTQVTPTLAVQLDGDTAALALVPDSLIDPRGLAVNDRVRCELTDRALIIHGKAGSGALEAYPVGSIYMSVTSTDPGTIFGGTWAAWGTGRVPVAVDAGQTEFATVELTGGEKTHVLTTAEMPGHQHDQYVTAGSGGAAVRTDYTGDGAGVAYPQGATTGSTGGGGAHNNLQPFITCFMWKRTA